MNPDRERRARETITFSRARRSRSEGVEEVPKGASKVSIAVILSLRRIWRYAFDVVT